MRIPTSHVLASIAALSLGCVTTQDLGAPAVQESADAGPRIDDQRQGFEFPSAPSTAAECPAQIPDQGADCSAVRVARECTYAFRDFQNKTCGNSCVCAAGGKWRCFDAPCPVRLDDSTCVQGMACAGAVRCWAHCDGTTPTSTCLSCTCVDGKLACRDFERPPR